MSMNTTIITAETEPGVRALQEVMRRSYETEIDSVPPRWARTLLVDGEPTSFILVDPERNLEFLDGSIPYAFINDIATRGDKRGQGWFNHLLNTTCEDLRTEGLAVVICHGSTSLYRKQGFCEFTYNCGLWIDVDRVLKHCDPLGSIESTDISVLKPDITPKHMLVVENMNQSADHRAILLQAADHARESGKASILFEYPEAPSYGSSYPVYEELITTFSKYVLRMGGRLEIRSSLPDGEKIDHTDWMKIIDPALLMRQVMNIHSISVLSSFYPIVLEVDSVEIDPLKISAGDECENSSLSSRERISMSHELFAKLFTGFETVGSLVHTHRINISESSKSTLTELFPQGWRLSRNENWVFGS